MLHGIFNSIKMWIKLKNIFPVNLIQVTTVIPWWCLINANRLFYICSSVLWLKYQIEINFDDTLNYVILTFFFSSGAIRVGLFPSYQRQASQTYRKLRHEHIKNSSLSSEMMLAEKKNSQRYFFAKWCVKGICDSHGMFMVCLYFADSVNVCFIDSLPQHKCAHYVFTRKS